MNDFIKGNTGVEKITPDKESYCYKESQARLEELLELQAVVRLSLVGLNMIKPWKIFSFIQARIGVLCIEKTLVKELDNLISRYQAHLLVVDAVGYITTNMLYHKFKRKHELTIQRCEAVDKNVKTQLTLRKGK